MYCKKCGRQLPDYAKYCPDCGWAVDSCTIQPSLPKAHDLMFLLQAAAMNNSKRC